MYELIAHLYSPVRYFIVVLDVVSKVTHYNIEVP